MNWKWYLFKGGEIEMQDRSVTTRAVEGDLEVIQRAGDEVLFRGESLIVVERVTGDIAIYVRVP